MRIKWPTAPILNQGHFIQDKNFENVSQTKSALKKVSHKGLTFLR